MSSEVIKRWEEMQTKTFTKWVNMHLAKKGMSIDSILTGFKDGTKLIELLQVIGEATLPKYVVVPKMRIQMLENITKGLKFIEERGVKLASIGPNDICDGNVKLTLGMIWTIILRFEISELSEEGLSAKQGLLLWCQRKTEDYDNVKVENFQESFKDGLAFCALIHKHRPELIPYETLSSENAKENLDLAFDVAEKELGIAKLLDTADIVEMPKPDERSIMTYCAALYKVFSVSDQAEKAGRRLAKFAELLKQTELLKNDYEERATKLVQSVTEKNQELQNAEFANDYQGIKAQSAEFKKYRCSIKRPFVAEQSELVLLLGNIQSKLKTMHRPPFQPKQGLTTDDISQLMAELFESESEYVKKLHMKTREVLDFLRKAFADPANSFHDDVTSYRKLLAEDKGTPEEAVVFFTQTEAEIKEKLEPMLPVIEEKEKDCEAATIEDNEYSYHSYDDLSFSFGQLITAYANKIAFLNGQIEEAKGSTISAEQLAEIKRSFEHFDADKTGVLERLEFKSAMSSMGIIDVNFSDKADTKFEKLWNDVSEGKGVVSFEQYQKFMITTMEERISPEQLGESLEAICGGKNHVTEVDLRKANMDEETIQYLLSTMPPKDGIPGGYDYKAWIAEN